MEKYIKVMVVDDSAFMRRVIGDLVRGQQDMQLVGTARNGEEALAKMERYNPDVITLDVEMPRLDGLATLKKIMEKEKPLPVIMVSTYTGKGSEITLEALSSGAVDFVTKPSLVRGENLEDLRILLPEKIRAAARARITQRLFPASPPERVLNVYPPPLKGEAAGAGRAIRNVVAIGASTGGPRALEVVLRGLPSSLPAAVFITQHMPPQFTASLAERLNRLSALEIKEAVEGEVIRERHVYIAPGGFHLLVDKGVSAFLSQAPPVQHVRPSADVMMNSLAEIFGNNTIGVILTGMGKDGTAGMKMIKERGGRTIVQDPSTAVIPGMPQSVINSGAADITIPLVDLAEAIMRLVAERT